MHSTIRAAEGDFIPSASAYAFGRRPDYFKRRLRLRPNVKNTASVIHYSFTLDLKKAVKKIKCAYMI